MELLRELTKIQHEHGYLDDVVLRDIAREMNVPLYRLEGLVSFYTAFRRTPPPRVSVRICRDISCRIANSQEHQTRLREQLADRPDVEISEVSCLGRCDSAPAIAINESSVAPASLADLDSILGFVERPDTVQDEPGEPRGGWKCDPYAGPADHYGTVVSLVAGGDVKSACLAQLRQSRLSGMGGAGFPTGQKLELVAAQSADPKYVICNADESEPGTFKDRHILEQLPHLVIEGMVLAGLIVGSQHGIVYLRHEYGREQKALEAALVEARRRGVLGPDAAGSGQPFDIEIFVSPGGYILGEETALLEALEDKRGEPRNKPPYPSTHGLWGKPTLINNVETFALGASIVHHGADWWAAQGRPNFAGLKFVCISGDVERPGVYEIPIGMTVNELIELAGGMKNDEPLKAFLPGGASSNFLTAAHGDTPLDFQAMKQAGSMLGTGAVIVVSQRQDLFALAANVVRFFRNESCGKCVPCRLGTEQASQLLEEVQAGATPVTELKQLDGLGETLEQTSICGLGQVALNPILSMMRHFPGDIPG